MKILIKVTKEILARSAMCNSNTGMNCAIVCAINDLIPNCWVAKEQLYVYEDESTFILFLHMRDMCMNSGVNEVKPKLIIDLPEKAIDFIDIFDYSTPEYRKAMQPISFEIDVPNELIEKIGIGEVYKVLSESKTLEHVNT